MAHSEDGSIGATASPGGPGVTEVATALHDLVNTARRRRLAVAVGSLALLVAVGAVVSAAASVSTSVGVNWSTGVVLAILLVLTWILCAHAGGHAWLVPVPAGALAVLWLIAVSSGHQSSAAEWGLAGASAGLIALAVTVAGTALRQGGGPVGWSAPVLRGVEGVAVTALDPVGVVQLAGETWTAESVSGPLLAGAPVHVISTQGLRLVVWSEHGTVPGPSVLDSKEISS